MSLRIIRVTKQLTMKTFIKRFARLRLEKEAYEYLQDVAPAANRLANSPRISPRKRAIPNRNSFWVVSGLVDEYSCNKEIEDP